MVKVLKAGFYTSVQDLGRQSQEFGVPISGAMDVRAHTLANALLGNSEHLAILEVTLSGPKLEFLANTVIAITGATCNPELNGVLVEQNRVLVITEGDVLSISNCVQGVRAYVSVKHGFNTEMVLQSRSFYKGITKQFRLQKNDVLPIENYISNRQYTSSVKVNDTYLTETVLNVFKGAEFDSLTQEQQEQLLSQQFTVSQLNNRMAYQLTETIKNSMSPIITSMVLPGTVQLTPSGKLIILMRDCQTTGGYPRVLQLSEMAINILAQKKQNDVVRFKLVKHQD